MSISAHKRHLRAFAALVIMAVLLAMPFQAFAAKGVGLERSITALGSTVTGPAGETPGGLAAFRLRFENGTSNISHFQFVGDYTNATYVGSSPNICEGDKPAAQQVTCSSGGLAGGAIFEVVVVLRADGGGNVTLGGIFSGDARKAGPGAKQDTWPVNAATVTLGTGDDIYASWQQDLEAAFGLPSSSQQVSVSVTRGSGGYFTMIEQSTGDLTCTDPNTGQPRTITGYGKIIDLQVANGGSASIEMTITFAPAPGLNANTVKIVHERNGLCHEVSADCVAFPNDCYTAETVRIGNTKYVQVTLSLPHNGRFKGF